MYPMDCCHILYVHCCSVFFSFDTVICKTGYIQNKYIVVSYSAFIWIIREGSPSMTFDTEFGAQASPAIKFLAVQDSSIGDLVSQ